MSTGPELSPELLAIIVCPACKGELVLGEAAGAGSAQLVCGSCDLAYPVRDGIPVLLVDEARPSR